MFIPVHGRAGTPGRCGRPGGEAALYACSPQLAGFGETPFHLICEDEHISLCDLAVSANGSMLVGGNGRRLFLASNNSYHFMSPGGDEGGDGGEGNGNGGMITTSSTGQHIAAVCHSRTAPHYPILYLSSDFGETWRQAEGLGLSFRQEPLLAMSSTGKCIVVTNGGALVASDDFGRSFKTVFYRPKREHVWTALAISGNGHYLFAANGHALHCGEFAEMIGDGVGGSGGVGGGGCGGCFPVVCCLSESVSIAHLASNDTGCICLCFTDSGKAYHSGEYGRNMKCVNSITAKVAAAAMNASGQYQMVVTTGNGVYYSTDFGNAFQTSSVAVLPASLSGLCMSATGQQVFAVTSSGIYQSIAAIALTEHVVVQGSLDVSHNITTAHGNIIAYEGGISTMSGNISTANGNVNALNGQVNARTAHFTDPIIVGGGVVRSTSTTVVTANMCPYMVHPDADDVLFVNGAVDIVLPETDVPSGKFLYIVDAVGEAAARPIVLHLGDVSTPFTTIDWSFGTLSLISDGTHWFIWSSNK